MATLVFMPDRADASPCSTFGRTGVICPHAIYRRLTVLLLGLLLWPLAAAFRLVLIIVGWFFIPLTFIADGKHRTPPLWRGIFGNVADVPASHAKNLWTKYVWMAWRNPVEGLDSTLRQPLPEVRPNPDELVRTNDRRAAHRWMAHGVFWEYWYLRRIGNRFFEFRIGWKFVDGNDDFVPTLQFGLKK